MMNELRIFTHEEFGSVRTMMIDGEPWFVGKDVALILGYKNPQKSIRDHVDVEDRTVNDSFTVNGTAVVLINESGLYSLIFSSKMPFAKRFKHWVTSKVLRELRKNGYYSVKQAENLDAESILSNPRLVARLMNDYADTLEKVEVLELETKEQKKTINKMQPKVEFCDKVLSGDGLIPVTVIAKEYGMSAQAFNKLLLKFKFQRKVGGTYVPCKKYEDKGYMASKTILDRLGKPRVHYYLTHKSRMFLYCLLKSNGILPIKEKEEKQIEIFSLVKA